MGKDQKEPLVFRVTGEIRPLDGLPVIVDVDINTGITMHDLYVMFALAGNGAAQCGGSYSLAADAAVTIAADTVRLRDRISEARGR